MIHSRHALLLTILLAALVLLGGRSAEAGTTTGGECEPNGFSGTPMDPFMASMSQVFAAGAPQSHPASMHDVMAMAKAVQQEHAKAVQSARCGLPPDVDLLRRYRHHEHLSPSQFIDLIAPLAQRAEQTTGVPASVTIAQAIQETGFGKSAHAAGNNLFGIKGHGDAGSLRLLTKEFVGGRYVTIRANFAAYRSLEDSVVAHARFVTSGYFQNTRGTSNANAFVSKIARDGYATDPHYASELLGLISRYDLTRYDGSVDCEGSGPQTLKA